MKLQIFLLSLLIHIQYIFSQTCADNPLIPHLKKFVRKQNKFVEEAIQKQAERKAKEIWKEQQKEKKKGGKKRNLQFQDYSSDYIEDSEDYYEDSETYWADLFSEQEENEDDDEQILMKRFLKGKKKGGKNGNKKNKDKDEDKEDEKEKKKKKKEREKKKKEREQKQKNQIEDKLIEQMKKNLFDNQDIQSIIEATPTYQQDMGICQSLDGEISCCTKRHINQFKKLTKGYYLQKFRNKPKSKQILTSMLKIFKKGVRDGTCQFTRQDGETFREIFDKDDYKSIMADERECQADAIIVSQNLIRGTICQACMDPAKYSTVFDGEDGEWNEVLLVLPNVLQKYRQKMREALQCYKSAKHSFKDLLKLQFNELKEYLDNDGCSAVIDSIILKLSHKKDIACNNDPIFFKDRCIKEVEDGENEDENEQIMRLLVQEAQSNYREDPNGVPGVYQEDPEEEQELRSLPDELNAPPVELEDEDEYDGDQNGTSVQIVDEGSANIIQFGIVSLLLLLLNLI